MEGKLSDLSVVMDMKAKELTNLDKWYGMEKGDPGFSECSKWVFSSPGNIVHKYRLALESETMD